MHGLVQLSRPALKAAECGLDESDQKQESRDDAALKTKFKKIAIRVA